MALGVMALEWCGTGLSALGWWHRAVSTRCPGISGTAPMVFDSDLWSCILREQQFLKLWAVTKGDLSLYDLIPLLRGSALGTGSGDVQDDCEKRQHRSPLCLSLAS